MIYSLAAKLVEIFFFRIFNVQSSDYRLSALIPNLLSESDKNQYIDVYRCIRCIDF